MMKKRYFSILMLLIAYTIYIAHGIIPHHHHHHHDEHSHDQGHEHHHTSGSHHDDNNQDEGINFLFSHLVHAEDGFTNPGGHSAFKNFIKQYSSQFALLPFEINFSKTEIPPLIVYSPPEVSYFISYVARFAGLRAPPFYIA